MKITRKCNVHASASVEKPDMSEIMSYLNHIVSDVNARVGFEVVHGCRPQLMRESDNEYTVHCDLGDDIVMDLTVLNDEYGSSGKTGWHFTRDWEYEADDLIDYLYELEII